MRFRARRTEHPRTSILLEIPGADGAPHPVLGFLSAPTTPASADKVLACFGKIRTERLGGAFWHPDAAVPPQARVLVSLPHGKAASQALWDHVAGLHDPSVMVAPAPGTNLHPLLAQVDEIWAASVDTLALLGAIHGKRVMVRVGDAPPATLSQHEAAAWMAAHVSWQSPFTHRPIDFPEAVAIVSDARRTWDRTHDVAVCVGMAWWKKTRVRAFFHAGRTPPAFRRTAAGAVRLAGRDGGTVATWTSRVPVGLLPQAARAGVPVALMEDGFVRSVGLGSDLLPPSSIVLDRTGIYFDPSRPSDLETLLAEAAFNDALRTRAAALIRTLVARQISKYGSTSDTAHTIRPGNGKQVLLVPGQVANDLSIRLGAGAISDNLALLKAVRHANPDAHIVFRPHPDVDAGHRPGAIPDDLALSHADQIARGGAMIPLIAQADALHTMTSLAGFEALLRGVRVTTYGTPFYAGWGLTHDLAPPTGRRTRALTLEELVAGALVLYPLYLDPVTNLPCGPEVLIERLSDGRLWAPPVTVRLRRIQGRLGQWGRQMVTRARTV